MADADVPPAPAARIEVVHDTYFGETLSDPYRWMENGKDRDWLPFLKAQNDHTRAVLDAIAHQGRAAEAHPTTIGRYRSHQPRAARRRPDLLLAAAQGRGQLQAVRARGMVPQATACSSIPPRPEASTAMCRSTGGAPRRTGSTWCTACRRTAARTRCCTCSPSPTARPLPETIANTEDAQPALAR